MKRLIVLPLVLICFGCDSDSATISDQGVDDPFLLGNFWIYQHTAYDSSGAIVRTTDTTTVIARNSDLFKLNDIHYYPDADGIKGGPANGLWFKYPAKAGDTMSVTGNLLVKAVDSVFMCRLMGTVAGVNVPVVTPAGTFIAYKYHHDYIINDQLIPARSVTYLAPRIGIVKEEFYEFGPSFAAPLRLKFVKELFSYKIR